MVRLPLALLVAICLVFASAPLGADVRTDERTRVELAGMLGRMVNLFGGKGARDGVRSTVAVKGSRKITMSDDVGQIVDLSEEKIYTLDVRRKTYQVITFADLRRQMEEAREKAAAAAREEAKKNTADAPPPATQNENNVEFDLDVRNTGQTRTINGFETRQAIVNVTVREKGKTVEQSGGLGINTELWLAPQMPAMKEIVDFELRYAKQLYGPVVAGASPQDMASVMAMYPVIRPALERANAEAGKLEGTAIMSVTKVEAIKSAEQLAQEQAQRKEDSKVSVTGGVGGLLGGLARRTAQQKVQGDVTPRATVMTVTNELLKVSTQVADAEMAIPAGFKQQ